ncbi:MAG: hypothetical protein ACI9LM_003627 [Alteromonadaceae bacterium]
MSKFIIVITVYLFIFPLNAEIYKCNSNAVITFQDVPCDTADESLAFDSSKLPELKKSNFKDRLNLDCSLERLENAVTMKVNRSEHFYMICGRPANVNKDEFLKMLPNAGILDKSPEQGMKFIQAITALGYKYRVEWVVNEDIIYNATLFHLDKTKNNIPAPINRRKKPNYGSVSDRVFQAMDNRSLLCEYNWPNSNAMKKECEKQQRSSVSDIQDIMESLSTNHQSFDKFDECLTLWEKHGSIDLQMIVPCYKE